MSDNKGPTNFWTTLPGYLTGIAGLITAFTGIFLAIHATTKVEKPSPPKVENPSPPIVENPDTPKQIKDLTVYAESTRGEEFTNEENKPIKVNFTTSGKWIAIPEDEPNIDESAKGRLTAAGATNFLSNEDMPCPRFPMGALVVIKEDGSCVDSGETGSFELKQGEKVYLKMNDINSLYQDNEGDIQVGLSW